MPSDLSPAVTVLLTPVERYHVLREQIQHEDNLTTQRLSWLLASQAFLFSAYAIVLNGPERVPSSFVGAQRDWLLSAVPGLGLASALLIYLSILAGVLALWNLRRSAQPLCARETALHDFPPLQGTGLTRLAGLSSPLLVPPLFASVWLYLMLRGLAK